MSLDNKKITFHTAIKKTATQQPIETMWCVFASDYNSVQVEFVVTDLRPDEIRTVTPTIILIMDDGSTVQRTKEQIVQKNNVFSYKLKDREGQHTGVVKAQLKMATVTDEVFQSNIYTFTILESLDSIPVPKEFVIDDIQNILQEVKHHINHIFKDETTRKQVFADFIKNATLNEKQRETWFNQSQQTRASLFQVFKDEAQDVLKDAQQVKDLFDELVETGIVESNIADKLSDLEVSYAPRLSTLEQNDVSLTSQLAQTQQDFDVAVGAITEDSEVILARNEETTLGERLDKSDNRIKDMNDKVDSKANKSMLLNPKYDLVYDSCVRDVNTPLDAYSVPMESGHYFVNVDEREKDTILTYEPEGVILADIASNNRFSPVLIEDFEVDFPSINVRFNNVSLSHVNRSFYIKYLNKQNWIRVNAGTNNIVITTCIDGVETEIGRQNNPLNNDFGERYGLVQDVHISYTQAHTLASPSGKVVVVRQNDRETFVAGVPIEVVNLFDKQGKVGFDIQGRTEILNFKAGRVR